jgi:protein SCO1/2
LATNTNLLQNKKMKNKVILTILIVTLALLAGVYYHLKHSRPVLSSMPIGGEFSIPSTKGKFELKNYRGKVVILYFGYLFCPDICPTTLATLGALLKQMPNDDASQVQVVFISVDPKRDTLPKIKDYVEFFHPTMIGATDTEDNVAKIAKKYAVAYEKYYPKKGEAFYTVDHSTQAFLIRKDGKVGELIRHGETAMQIQEKLNKYIKD